MSVKDESGGRTYDVLAPLDEERSDAVRALEAEFSTLIMQFRRIITENAERVAPGMLPGAYKVFTTIARLGRTPASDLATELMIDKGQLSRTVRELEHLGLVAREPDPGDGRVSILFPTPLGLERLAAARSPQRSSLQEALTEWPLDEIRDLTRLLHALGRSRPARD